MQKVNLQIKGDYSIFHTLLCLPPFPVMLLRFSPVAVTISTYVFVLLNE
jgi:hypothetical protein